MSKKTFPLNKEQLEAIIEKYPTPFHIYDEKAIRANIRALQQAFAWAPRFREQFAVKALPNPRILQILHEEGAGTDNSSLAELVLSEASGYRGEEILLTSNDTPADEFQKAIELGAIINLDDLSHLDYLEQHAGLPQVLCFRYNPGDLMEGNDIIGKPTEAKYGLTREQLFEAIAVPRRKASSVLACIRWSHPMNAVRKPSSSRPSSCSSWLSNSSAASASMSNSSISAAASASRIVLRKNRSTSRLSARASMHSTMR